MSHAAIDKGLLLLCCQNYLKWRQEEIDRLKEEEVDDVDDVMDSFWGNFLPRKYAIRYLKESTFSRYNCLDNFQSEKKEIALRLITLCDNTSFPYVMVSTDHAFILNW